MVNLRYLLFVHNLVPGVSLLHPLERETLSQGGGMKRDPGNEVDLFIVSPRFCYIMLIGDLQTNLK